MSTAPAAAVLPSREEPDTIVAVTQAVDAALSVPDTLLINVDSSETSDTSNAFRGAAPLGQQLALSGLLRGKGRQIRAGLERLDAHMPVLLADTDTRNPRPHVYRRLVQAVRDGAAMAIADYPHYWDEVNLSQHLARPLIAATGGWDVVHPLAGDLALAPATWQAALAAWSTLPPALASCVDGYGIDVFLLQVAATCGPVVSLPTRETKRHGPSFSHLAASFTEVVPVLLRMARSQKSSHVPFGPPRLVARTVSKADLDARCRRLAALRPQPRATSDPAWPVAVEETLGAVANSTPPEQAAITLWPLYLDRVKDWLSTAAVLDPVQRPALLHAWARDVLTTLIPGG